MAQPPYGQGVPDVAPTAAPPDDYQHMRATPEAFGADRARGMQQLGAGALDLSKNWGRIQTDDVLNNAMSEANEEVERYKTLRGGDALSAQEGVKSKIKEISDRSRGQLTSIDQQHAFDQAWRPFSERYLAGQVRTHSVTQGHDYATKTNHATYTNSLSMIPNAAHDEDGVKNLIADGVNAQVKQVELNGGGDEQKIEAINKATADGHKAWIEAVGAKDPVRAAEMAEKYKAELGSQYTSVATKFRAASKQQEGRDIADEVTGRTGMPVAPVANVPAGFVGAIKQSEGFSPKAKWDFKQFSYGYGTKASKEGETITREEADKQFNAKLEEAAKVVDGVNPNLDPGTRAAMMSLTFNAGNTWVNSGLGEKIRAGDVQGAKQNFLEYVRAGGEVNPGLMARRYRESQWFGAENAPVGGPPMIPKQQAYERAIEQTDGDPYAQSAAISRLNQIYSVYHQQAAQADAAFKQRVTDATTEGLATGVVQTPLTETEFVENAIASGKDPAEGIARYKAYQQNVQLGADMALLSTMGDKEATDLVDSYAPKPGPGYEASLKRGQEMERAYKSIQQEIKTDPAAFAMLRLPAVSSAYQKLQQAKTPEERKAAANDFALTTLSEQERVGVSPAKTAILPKAYIDQFNERATNPAGAGGTANVVQAIQGEAQLWGNHWPKVFGQISKDALPVVRVIGSGIKPLAAQILSDYAKIPFEKIVDDQHGTKSSAIKNEVVDAFQPFAKTLLPLEGGAQEFNDFQSQGQKLTAHYVNTGMQAPDAAKQAYNDLIGFKYQFEDTYRVPLGTGVSPSSVIDGARSVREAMMAGPSRSWGDAAAAAGTAVKDFMLPDLRPDRTRTPGLRDEYLKEQTRKTRARDGVWVTAPGPNGEQEAGLAMLYQGNAVLKADGRPLFYTWAQLGQMPPSSRTTEPAAPLGTPPVLP